VDPSLCIQISNEEQTECFWLFQPQMHYLASLKWALVLHHRSLGDVNQFHSCRENYWRMYWFPPPSDLVPPEWWTVPPQLDDSRTPLHLVLSSFSWSFLVLIFCWIFKKPMRLWWHDLFLGTGNSKMSVNSQTCKFDSHFIFMVSPVSVTVLKMSLLQIYQTNFKISIWVNLFYNSKLL